MNKKIAEEKNAVRKKMMTLRKSISKSDIETWSRAIMNRLFEMEEYKEANHVMFYVSYDNEVKTHEMIIKTLSSPKKVSVPLLEKEKIIPVEIRRWDELKPGAYGILEPRHKKESKISEIELVVVPGVAFEEGGYRIGHGLGCYDDFLKKVKGLKIGLAFEFQIIPEIPREEHDVSVDKIITEERVIECESQI